VRETRMMFVIVFVFGCLRPLMKKLWKKDGPVERPSQRVEKRDDDDVCFGCRRCFFFS
jgi:hypothetical protein